MCDVNVDRSRVSLIFKRYKQQEKKTLWFNKIFHSRYLLALVTLINSFTHNSHYRFSAITAKIIMAPLYHLFQYCCMVESPTTRNKSSRLHSTHTNTNIMANTKNYENGSRSDKRSVLFECVSERRKQSIDCESTYVLAIHLNAFQSRFKTNQGDAITRTLTFFCCNFFDFFKARIVAS